MLGASSSMRREAEDDDDEHRRQDEPVKAHHVPERKGQEGSHDEEGGRQVDRRAVIAPDLEQPGPDVEFVGKLHRHHSPRVPIGRGGGREIQQ